MSEEMRAPSLFDRDPVYAPAQKSLFEGGRLDSATTIAYTPDPSKVRQRLNAVLEKARRADRMPWAAREARMWQTIFPQMANWLPGQEAEQLRLEFARELERLHSAG